MTIVWVILGAYVLLVFAVVLLSVRPVRTPLFFSPSSIGIPQEDVEIESQNAKLRGWFLPQENPKGVVVMAHGYLMNRSEWASLAAAAHRNGYAALLFDFYGHGKSGASGMTTVGPREAKDVVAAVHWARQRCPGARVAIIGSSMGAAAAALAVVEHGAEADCLILDSCYSTLATAVLGWFGFIGGTTLKVFLAPSVLAAWLVTRVNPFGVDITRALQSVNAPVLIVHGDGDRLEGPAGARKNFNALSADHNSQIAIFHGANHGEAKWSSSVDYEKLVIEFLDATLQSDGDTPEEALRSFPQT